MRCATVGILGSLSLAAPLVSAQPGPNDATSQGSSADRTGTDSPEGSSERKIMDEDRSTAKGFVFENRERDFALNLRTRVQLRATAGGRELEDIDDRFEEGLAVLYRLQIGASPRDIAAGLQLSL